MEPLIYYPNFEPPDETWLKFALLYFENFKPIVPYNRRNLLTDNFRNIQDNTDLISLYAPDHEEGYRASLTAIEEATKILENSYDRSPLFRQTNIRRKWENSTNWNYLIYQEKFSYEWVNFCRDNNIGQQVDEGLLIPEELAFLYMTYLAKEIAFKESAAIITDNQRFDNFTNYSRSTTPLINSRNKFAKGIINMLVPVNLTEIPINRIIEFRNRNRELISAFNRELSNIQNKISEGSSERDFIDNYNSVYSELSRNVILQGIGVAAIPFAAYVLIQNPNTTSPEYIKEVLGSISMVLAGGYTLNAALRDKESRRYCKKYIANLERLR
ncbi:MAG: hypothetical protein JNJ41_11445 [Bacteroidia bacterium]|nr:hypothetical protein [Bacteroidia bacterium]